MMTIFRDLKCDISASLFFTDKQKMISPTVTEDFPLNKSLLRYYDNSVCLLVIISHKLPVYSPPDSASCHVCGIPSTCC